MKLLKFLSLIIFSLNSLSIFAAPTLSDSDAKRLIDTSWNEKSARVKLGALIVVRKGKVEKNDITDNEYEWYKAFEKAGLISISVDPKYKAYKSGDNFNWKDFQTQHSGVEEKIIVKKTDKGTKYSQAWKLPQTDTELLLKGGVYKTERIVKNEPLKSGTDDYRMLMFTYTADETPEFKQINQIMGKLEVKERKARMLAKYDPFKSKWKIVTYDLSSRDEEFKTENVTGALAKFRIKAGL